MPELREGDTPPAVPLRIELPEDETRVAALQAKREEYIGRIRYVAPDANYPGLDEHRYRISILNKLFEEGEVSSKDILEGLRDPEDPDEVFAAEEALRVVSDYCLTGGENLYGGTFGGEELPSSWSPPQPPGRQNIYLPVQYDTIPDPQKGFFPGLLDKIFPGRR
jgi:hypothetical protein